MVDNLTNNLNELINLSSDLASVKDVDLLMEKILESARYFVQCDAGSILIKEDDLEFRYTQNDTLNKINIDNKPVFKSFKLPIDSSSIAGYVAMKGETVNTPDAYDLPPGLPYGFDNSYDSQTGYTSKSLLTVPLKTGTGDIIGILQLINAKDKNGNIISFKQDLVQYVNFFANNAANALERALLMRTMLLRMIRMTRLRDPKETGDHVRRVGGYSVEIYETWAKGKGISQQEILHNRDVLHMAAMLHDVGKVAISDSILKKPGKLTEEEYEKMKDHTTIGACLLSHPSSEYEKAAQIVALNHHERYDGKGYPGHVEPDTGKPIEGFTDKNGRPLPKKGEDIPIFGRIVAIADVYDALSFQRVYKDAWEHEQVLALLWEERGQQFDPEIADALFDNLMIIQSIAERYSADQDMDNDQQFQ